MPTLYQHFPCGLFSQQQVHSCNTSPSILLGGKEESQLGPLCADPVALWLVACAWCGYWLARLTQCDGISSLVAGAKCTTKGFNWMRNFRGPDPSHSKAHCYLEIKVRCESGYSSCSWSYPETADTDYMTWMLCYLWCVFSHLNHIGTVWALPG